MENKVIDKFEEYCNLLDEGCPVILLTALKLLKEQPEVVRCENCVYSETAHDQKGNTWLYCFKNKLSPRPDWYCADGTRKGLERGKINED